jgi:KaiC/GvpD/RAD55 family RecA-like ATPase
MDAAGVESLIQDRITRYEEDIVRLEATTAARVEVIQESIDDLKRLQGKITDRDIKLYQRLKTEGILAELTR